LEFGHIHVQGAIETQRCRERGHNLSDKTVEVGVRGALNVEVAMADVVAVFKSFSSADGSVLIRERVLANKNDIAQ
jgi:DNA integrity scanning protein DisA with diadenylate cyclase activity